MIILDLNLLIKIINMLLLVAKIIFCAFFAIAGSWLTYNAFNVSREFGGPSIESTTGLVVGGICFMLAFIGWVNLLLGVLVFIGILSYPVVAGKLYYWYCRRKNNRGQKLIVRVSS